MDRLGVAVIGASHRSTMIFGHLQKRPENGYITGVYDLIPARGQHLIDAYEATEAKVYDSLEQAVGDPRVDAVFVTTHDGAHMEGSVAALNADKHVFCEKPMEISLERCDAIAEAARRSKGLFYLGMNLRHGPVHAALHRILESGKLGKVLTIETNEYYYGGKTYFRRWNRLRKYGGGLWITKAVHDCDLLNWFAQGQPKRVYAASSLSHYRPREDAATHCRICKLAETCPDYCDINADSVQWALRRITEEQTGELGDLCLWNSDKDTFDNGQMLVEYDNDIRANYTVNVVAGRGTRQMRLMGTDGAAEGDMSEGTVCFWKRHENKKQVQDVRELMKSGHGGSDRGIVEDFFDCCRTGKAPRSSWQEGRAGVRLGLAARESCDTGMPVDLPIE